MFFGLDGVEVGLIIVAICLFGGILSGFPVAFAIAGAGVISFGIIAALDSAGLLIHQAIDTSSQIYRDLVNSGVKPDTIVCTAFNPPAEAPIAIIVCGIAIFCMLIVMFLSQWSSLTNSKPLLLHRNFYAPMLD